MLHLYREYILQSFVSIENTFYRASYIYRTHSTLVLCCMCFLSLSLSLSLSRSLPPSLSLSHRKPHTFNPTLETGNPIAEPQTLHLSGTCGDGVQALNHTPES